MHKRWGEDGIKQVEAIRDEIDAEVEEARATEWAEQETQDFFKNPEVQPEVVEPAPAQPSSDDAASDDAEDFDPDTPAWFVKLKAAEKKHTRAARAEVDETKVAALLNAARAEVAERAKAKAQPEPEPEDKATEDKATAGAATAKALTVIEQPKVEAELIPADETPEENAVREMNDKHAVISNLGGKCVIMEWVPSAISEGQKELSYQSFQAFRERYANQYVVVPGRGGRWETEAFAPLWLAHPHRRQYEGLDLVPGGPRGPAEWLPQSVEGLGRRAAQGQLAADAAPHR